MGESPVQTAPDVQETGYEESTVEQQHKISSNGTFVAMSAEEPVSDPARECGPATCAPAEYLAHELEDAERLLRYAAEAGIEVETNTRRSVFTMRMANDSRVHLQTMDNFLAAMTTLAAKLRPVTAESLKVCADAAVVAKIMSGYKKVAISLACCIIPVSLATFVTSGLSEAIRKDVETANKLAVKLGDELGPLQVAQAPGTEQSGAVTLPHGVTRKDVIVDLQEFAATIRAIDARARQLNFFVAYRVADPFAEHRSDRLKMKEFFELPQPLGVPDLAGAATQKISALQDVRHFAQSIQETVSTFYGAITTCILPVLYALLGACAFLLRSFEEQIKTRTFTLSDAHLARFVIAAIGGAVVGLFNNFTLTQSASIPPLAIAFLVGYAVDVFFSFLEGLLQTFNRSRSQTGASAASANAKS